MHVKEYCESVRVIATDIVNALVAQSNWAEILHLAEVGAAHHLANTMDSEAVKAAMALRQTGEVQHG